MLFNFQGLSRERKTEKQLQDGGVAQLGEHLPCKQGVMGSNPIISTSRKKAAKGIKRDEQEHNGLIAQVVRARA